MMDSDLQQYNGTQAFPATADVGTNADTFLLPTDGPIVTADSNGANMAPVNRGGKRIKDYILGLRAALLGDFAGAVQKTVKSLYADLTGGTTHTKTPGTVYASGPAGGVGTAICAETGDVVASLGFLKSSTGAYVGNGTEDGRLLPVALRFIGTTNGAGGANPPRATPFKNQLRAKNIPKLWGRVAGSGGVFSIHEGFGGWTATLVDLSPATDPYRIRITIDAGSAMDNANYAPVFGIMGAAGSGRYHVHAVSDTMTTTQFDIVLLILPTLVIANVTTDVFDVSFHVDGQQTS